MGSSTRFHAPRTFRHSLFLDVIGLEDVFNHCRGRGAVFWLAGDDIAGREDEGGWVLITKQGNALRIELSSQQKVMRSSATAVNLIIFNKESNAGKKSD